MNREYKIGDLVKVVGEKGSDDRHYKGKTLVIGSLKATTTGGKFNYINEYICPLTNKKLPYGGGIWLSSVELVEEPVEKEYYYEIY